MRSIPFCFRGIQLVLLVCAPISLRALPAAAQGKSAQEQLWDAAMQGDTAAMATALRQGATIDSLDARRNPNGRRALNWAAWYNHPVAIRFLVARGATVSMPNRTGFTPLHHAVENGSLEAARALVSVGANLTLRNRFGRRPLDLARLQERWALVALLDSVTTRH